VILDNSITAMTGMQPTPESGTTADGHPRQVPFSRGTGESDGVNTSSRQPLRHQGMIGRLRKLIIYKTAEGGMAVLISRYPCLTYQKEILQGQPTRLDSAIYLLGKRSSHVKSGSCRIPFAWYQTKSAPSPGVSNSRSMREVISISYRKEG